MAMSWLGFGGSSVDIEFDFRESENRSKVWGRNDAGEAELQYLFSPADAVTGNVHLKVKGKKVEHIGIKLELVGMIDFLFDKGNPYEFTSFVRELEGPGELTADRSYPFDFPNALTCETYNGTQVRLRYFLRVTISRQYATNIRTIKDFSVQVLHSEPENNAPIKMEVGIEDCLHIEFEYSRSKFHLADVIIGKIYFLLVRIKIKYMEIVVIRRETCGSSSASTTSNPASLINESQNIAKFEIMDGAPVRGESIPLRLFLSPYDLTPTMKNIQNKFSVRYYLNLVLVDEEDRRYFKQQEIILWRKVLKPSVNNKDILSPTEFDHNPATIAQQQAQQAK